MKQTLPALLIILLFQTFAGAQGIFSAPVGGVGSPGFRIDSDLNFLPVLHEDKSELSGSFFAIWYKVGDQSDALCLNLKNPYGLPAPETLECKPAFPIMHALFADRSAPISEEVTICSTLIPSDIVSSSIPGVLFLIHFHNPLPVEVEASALISWESPFLRRNGKTIVPAIPASGGYFGRMIETAGDQSALMTFPNLQDVTVTSTSWDASTRPDWWTSFAHTGDIPADSVKRSAFGRASCALSVRLKLAPGEEATIPFAVTWHRSNASAQTKSYYPQYPSASFEAERLLQNWLVYYSLTREWQDYLIYSELPKLFVDRLMESTQLLVTGASLNDKGELHFHNPDRKMSSIQKLQADSLRLIFFPAQEAAALSSELEKMSELTPHSSLLLADVDEISCFLLKSARYILWMGDFDFLNRLSHQLPALEQKMEALQTPTFASLTGLRVIERLETILQKVKDSRSAEQAADRVEFLLNNTLWNGSGYSISDQDALPVMQLIAYQIGLDSLLPADRTLITLRREFSYSASAAALGIRLGAPETGLQSLQKLSLNSIESVSNWDALYSLEGVRLNMLDDTLTLVPRLPGAWRKLNSPLFTPVFWANLNYVPEADGASIHLNVMRLFTPVSSIQHENYITRQPSITLKFLRLPAPPPPPRGEIRSAPVIHVSIENRPLGGKIVEESSGMILYRLDTPLLLNAGDRLNIYIH